MPAIHTHTLKIPLTQIQIWMSCSITSWARADWPSQSLVERCLGNPQRNYRGSDVSLNTHNKPTYCTSKGKADVWGISNDQLQERVPWYHLRWTTQAHTHTYTHTTHTHTPHIHTHHTNTHTHNTNTQNHTSIHTCIYTHINAAYKIHIVIFVQLGW